MWYLFFWKNTLKPHISKKNTKIEISEYYRDIHIIEICSAAEFPVFKLFRARNSFAPY